MFCSFGKNPRILRFFCWGEVCLSSGFASLLFGGNYYGKGVAGVGAV